MAGLWSNVVLLLFVRTALLGMDVRIRRGGTTWRPDAVILSLEGSLMDAIFKGFLAI